MNRSLIALALCTLGSSLTAQQLTGALDLGSGLEQGSTGPWLRRSQVAPSLRFDLPFASVMGRTTGIERIGRLNLGQSSAEALFSSPSFGPFALSAATHVDDDRSVPGLTTTRTMSEGAASMRVGSSGIFAATARDRGNDDFGPLHGRTISLGAWHTRGALAASVALRSRELREQITPRTRLVPESTWTDTIGWTYWSKIIRSGPDSSLATQRWNELDARVEWALGRLALNAAIVAPTRHDSLRPPSLELGGLLRVGSRAWLIGEVGRRSTVALPTISARYASLGMRLSVIGRDRTTMPLAVRPAASSFRVEDAEGGLRRLVIRVASARIVELSGDFTRWQPVVLHERSPNEWEAILPIAAGTHYLNIRINGDNWSPPPGLAVVDDGFGGRSGVMVVR